jgi:hypothetical protein
MKLFGILNKQQGMMKLNDEGIFFAIVFVQGWRLRQPPT